MAKTKAPLFSLDATGTLDKNITYKGKKQSNIAQKYSKPGAVNPFESSPRQKDQRSIIRLITIHWQCMSSADKLSWNSAAKDVRFKGTGYHYFLHMAQQNLTQYLGLVGYWSMNYNIDDKIPDLSGNGYHGTLSPIYPCDCPQPVDSFDIKLGKALSFDGLDDYIDMGNVCNMGTGDLTIESLIKTTVAGGWRGLFAKGTVHPQYVFRLYEGFLSGRISYSTGLDIKTTSAELVNDGSWHYVAITFDRSSDMTLYIDGLPVKSADISSLIGLSITNTQSLLVGSMFPAAYRFNGLIDESLRWNRTLSELEIKKHYSMYFS